MRIEMPIDAEEEDGQLDPITPSEYLVQNAC